MALNTIVVYHYLSKNLRYGYLQHLLHLYKYLLIREAKTLDPKTARIEPYEMKPDYKNKKKTPLNGN